MSLTRKRTVLVRPVLPRRSIARPSVRRWHGQATRGTVAVVRLLLFDRRSVRAVASLWSRVAPQPPAGKRGTRLEGAAGPAAGTGEHSAAGRRRADALRAHRGRGSRRRAVHGARRRLRRAPCADRDRGRAV